MTLEIMYASDEDNYQNIWFNGERYRENSDVTILNVLWDIEHFINESSGSIDVVKIHGYLLDKANVSDIPKNISTCEELEKWYKDFTGSDITKY